MLHPKIRASEKCLLSHQTGAVDKFSTPRAMIILAAREHNKGHAGSDKFFWCYEGLEFGIKLKVWSRVKNENI